VKGKNRQNIVPRMEQEIESTNISWKDFDFFSKSKELGCPNIFNLIIKSGTELLT